MPALITFVPNSLSVAPDGVTLSGTLSGGSGAGYAPAEGVLNIALSVNGALREFCKSSISGNTWTGVAFTPIRSSAVVTVVVDAATGVRAGMTALSDSAGNTAVVQAYPATNGSTRGSADVIAATKSIPAAWDAAWNAILANHASQLIEAQVLGDSTAVGSGESTQIGWIYKTRQRAVAVGITNGGQGLVQAGADAIGWQGYVENLQPYTQRWAGAGTQIFGPAVMGAVSSAVANETCVLKFRGTRARLYYNKYNIMGEFTYKVNDGPVVMVNAWATGEPDTAIIDIAGLPDAEHTVTLVNAGSRTQPIPIAPTIGGQGAPNTGALPAGTYRYAVTGVDASGNETLPALTNTVTVDASNRSAGFSISNATIGNTVVGYKIYRSFNSGPYQFITQVAKGGGGFGNFTDTNSIAPTATEPPTVATLTRDTAAKYAGVGLEAMRNAGLVFHKDAVSGATFGTYGLDGNATQNFLYQTVLGLNHARPATSKAPSPPWRNVKLAICALGINNQQGGQTSTTLVATGLQTFYNAALLAGALPLFVIPHYSRANSVTTAKPFIDLVKAFCAANNCPWVDFNVVLDEINFGRNINPHIPQTGYDAEGSYIWDSVLSSQDTLAPTVGGVTLAQNGTSVTMPFSEQVSGVSTGGFTFYVDGVSRPSAVSGSGAARAFELSAKAYPDQELTFTYTGTTVADTAGNLLQPIPNGIVTNGSTQVRPDELPPTILSAALNNTGGKIILPPSEPVNGAGLPSDWLVTIGVVAREVNGAQLGSNGDIELLLLTPGFGGAATRVSYVGTSVKDLAATPNALAAFSNATVDTTAAPAAPTPAPTPAGVTWTVAELVAAVRADLERPDGALDILRRRPALNIITLAGASGAEQQQIMQSTYDRVQTIPELEAIAEASAEAVVGTPEMRDIYLDATAAKAATPASIELSKAGVVVATRSVRLVDGRPVHGELEVLADA